MPAPSSGSSASAPERRLAVLLSHLHPWSGRELPRSTARLASAEHERLGTAAAMEGALSTSPCSGGEKAKSSVGGHCVFCNIVAGTAQAFKLYEDDVCLCILDAKPLATGHSLIIPKSHYPSLQTTPPTVLADICSKLPLLGTAIMKATQCDAFNVLINNGEKAGQVIFHTHVHIIPRSKDDNLWSSETYSRNPISHGHETKHLVSSIKEVISSSPKDHGAVMPSTTKEL